MSSDLHKHTKGVQDSLTHTEGRGEGDKRVQTSVYEHKEQCSDRSRECSLELPLHCALTASCREKRARALGKKGHHRDRGLWAAATDAETPDLVVLIPLLIWRVLRSHRLLRISAPFSAPWFLGEKSCPGLTAPVTGKSAAVTGTAKSTLWMSTELSNQERRESKLWKKVTVSSGGGGLRLEAG